jgi:hypothetical protein
MATGLISRLTFAKDTLFGRVGLPHVWEFGAKANFVCIRERISVWDRVENEGHQLPN